MTPQFLDLQNRLNEINDLNAAAAVLYWDQATYMPPGGAPARGRQLSTLGRLAHEKFTDPAVGRLLEALAPWAEHLPPDSNEAALVRVTRRDYEKAIRVPAALISAISAHTSTAWGVWAKARPANDFAAVRPYLEQTLAYSRQLADCFPGYDHIADPLIDNNDYGMRAANLRTLFTHLREQLVPLVQAVTAQAPADDACLLQHFPEADQLTFGAQVAQRLGYDFNRGRQDKTHHPFATRFSIDDVRITTRVKTHDFSECFFSIVHEAGHAMYEQGVDPALEGTALAAGASAGIHESQSRLWENIVGRSRGFWEHFYPQLQAAFPEQFARAPLEAFYRAINKVARSLIRTDADELTYNLHVIIRFDLELQLLEGTLAVRDLPEAWHARYLADLGVRAPDDRDGCLQDMHWYSGLIGGAFQGYTLGNIFSGQLYAAALAAHPEIPAQIARGEFATLREWMRAHVYRHGNKFTAPEIIQRATGAELSIEPYMAYLRKKYAELYAL